MSTCLRPRFIKIDRRSTASKLYGCDSEYRPEWTRYRDVRPSLIDYVPVPCGKCINCLKNRQNALVSRCLEESEKRGTFIFLTLTYADEYLPIAQSLWRSSKVTGECEIVEQGEIISSARDSTFVDRAKVLSLLKSDKPRYYDSYIDGFEDDEYVYFSRLTPSVCRKDVRLWLKRARVTYERERGHKLSPFSYVCVSEYGPNTCRPHYHLAFFGLTPDESAWLASSWPYGFVCQRSVNRINPDGSDGFQIASRYIGKYMTKGKFECESVIDKCAEKPRICQSIGIGKSLIDKIKSQVLAYDMYGEYDIDTLFCPSLGRCFTLEEVNQLCKEIPKRLVYKVNSKFSLPIPRLFRQAIFSHQMYRSIHDDKQGKVTQK